MGNCGSDEFAVKNKVIEKKLREDFKAEKKNVKLLLLGAAEGGKSTILRQIKIIHDNGFSEEERLKRRPAVYNNIILGTAIIINGMKQLGLTFADPEVEISAEKVLAVVKRREENLEIPDELKLAIKRVWTDGTVQKQAIPRGNEFQFFESSPYFMADLDRICAPDYLPTTQDILMLRIPTTGIVETKFVIKKVNFRVFDVGGQRSERKKWIHCFDDVNAIIFVVAISEYDQVLCEDSHTNRLVESLRLFRSVCNSRWFFYTAMILFLNKKDLFAEKIKNNSIKCVFPDYKGSNSYDDQIRYLEEKFQAINVVLTKTIYIHETCATDTNQIQLILQNVFDLLLQKILEGFGMY